MGLFTKVFKTAANKADDLFTSKPVKTAASKVASGIKDFTNKGTLKTTSAVAQQGVSSTTSGGRKIIADVAKDTAKGAGTTAKIGGKVIAGTGIAAVPALTGIGLYNYYKNSTALTDEDRRLDYLLDKAKKAQDMGFDNSTGDPNVDNNPQARGNTGVGGSGAWNPFTESYGSARRQGHSGSGVGTLGLVLGAVAVAGGGYYLYKKSKKGKK